MKAAVLHKSGDLRYESCEEPKVSAGHVKVNVAACGVCGSDIPRLIGNEAHFFPAILGHEFSGTVTELGEGVTRLKVGDRVACAPLRPCMKCADCQQGNYSLCKNYSFIGSREQGGFAEYVVIPEMNAVPFSKEVSFEQGALFEPSTVALHGVFCADLHPGTDAAIIGTGNIGILAMQWLKILGARRVIVFDIADERLELAKSLGADAVFNTGDREMLKKVEEYTGGKGIPYVFETAGQPVTIKLCFQLVANKGKICCIGTPHKELVFDHKEWELLNRKEASLTATWMSYSAPFPGKEWEMTAHYFAEGKLKLLPSMIFTRVPLENCSDLIKMYTSPGAVKGKVLLVNEGAYDASDK